MERISRLADASAIDIVVSGHDIAAGAAIEVIVAGTAVEHVIAGKPIDLIVAEIAGKTVGPGRAVDAVGIGAADGVLEIEDLLVEAVIGQKSRRDWRQSRHAPWSRD